MRQVIVFRGEDGYWVVDCPSLPGCVSQGRSREEAIANIKEAIKGYIARTGFLLPVYLLAFSA